MNELSTFLSDIQQLHQDYDNSLGGGKKEDDKPVSSYLPIIHIFKKLLEAYFFKSNWYFLLSLLYSALIFCNTKYFINA